MKKISLIIPCYNEEESLPFFYKEAEEVLSKMDYDYYYFLLMMVLKMKL